MQSLSASGPRVVSERVIATSAPGDVPVIPRPVSPYVEQQLRGVLSNDNPAKRNIKQTRLSLCASLALVLLASGLTAAAIATPFWFRYLALDNGETTTSFALTGTYSIDRDDRSGGSVEVTYNVWRNSVTCSGSTASCASFDDPFGCYDFDNRGTNANLWWRHVTCTVAAPVLCFLCLAVLLNLIVAGLLFRGLGVNAVPLWWPRLAGLACLLHLTAVVCYGGAVYGAFRPSYVDGTSVQWRVGVSYALALLAFLPLLGVLVFGIVETKVAPRRMHGPPPIQPASAMIPTA